MSLFFILCFLGNFCSAQKESKREIILNYLTKTYPYSDTIFIADFMFDKKTKIEPIKTPFITTKTRLEIYKTTLITQYFEYMDLEIALSIDSNNKIKIAHSPTFDDTQHDFINSFVGITIENDSLKRKFISELTFVLSQITYKEMVKNIKTDVGNWTAELWTDDQKWRIIKIEYEDDKILKISQKNPAW